MCGWHAAATTTNKSSLWMAVWEGMLVAFYRSLMDSVMQQR